MCSAPPSAIRASFPSLADCHVAGLEASLVPRPRLAFRHFQSYIFPRGYGYLELLRARSWLEEIATSSAVCEMTQPGVLRPYILWAQRNDILMVTVNLTDIKHEKFSLDEKKLTFEGVGGPEGRQYACELEFKEQVVPQESKHKKTDRGIYFVIKKKTSGPYWSRLLSDSRKDPSIQTDFSKWKDEDESDSESENPYEDTSLNTLMQQMGGLDGGVGGKPNLDDLDDDSADSDDEPLPDLDS